MKLGKFQIDVFVENTAHVDGGMMFGVVPKKLWARDVTVNEENLVPMDMNIFVIRTGERTLIVDTGLGDMLSERQQKIYGTSPPSNLEPGLAKLGIKPDEVDYVIHTHLHLDHVGGAVKDDGNGNPVPRFSRAKHIVQKLEWNAANNPDDRSAAAYDKSKFMPIYDAGLLKIIEGAVDLIPGIRLVLTGGHTMGHQGVIIESEGERLFLFADIVPFQAHLRAAYVASADLFPLETIKIKKELLPDIAHHGWYLGFDHEIDVKVCRIVDTGQKFVAEKVEV
jgi:glyoxylase-like metal-dependent hydrolase (beta-lactamase superfamily II)